MKTTKPPIISSKGSPPEHPLSASSGTPVLSIIAIAVFILLANLVLIWAPNTRESGTAGSAMIVYNALLVYITLRYVSRSKLNLIILVAAFAGIVFGISIQ